MFESFYQLTLTMKIGSKPNVSKEISQTSHLDPYGLTLTSPSWLMSHWKMPLGQAFADLVIGSGESAPQLLVVLSCHSEARAARNTRSGENSGTQMRLEWLGWGREKSEVWQVGEIPWWIFFFV